MFDQILDKDEKVVEILKPNKTKFFVKVFLVSFISLLLVIGIFTFYFTIPLIVGESTSFAWLAIPIGILLILELLVMIFACMWYKKTFYAYTNKRIVIRTGIIGVDFKSLDIKMIGAVEVYVSLLDKIVGNTGTLRFGSMANPITSVNGAKNAFIFAHIKSPYDNYKKIKEHIEAQKQN